jgi:hypothetical protein
LRQQLRLDNQAEVEKIIASANARLTRPLGNGFRSEGRHASVGAAKVLLLSDRLRLDLRTSGRLKIFRGL